jgi:hypothetical protein
MITRRSLLQFTAIGIGTSAAAFVFPAAAAETTPLADRAVAACRRLAANGWRQLLLDVTSGELDLEDPDLGARLTRPLARIDRTIPGFGDFDIAATRPIEPGIPERSLLYHAFAAPSVVAGRNGSELTAFPTLAEIDAVEDFIYGAVPPSLEELRARAAGHQLGLVVFAVSYRNAPGSVYGTHAQLCFSRAGVARLGTIEPFYDARKRNFASLDENKPYDFRVLPCRFVAYIAVQVPGTWSRFGPQDRLPDDGQRRFWVPLHKLFSGKECIRGLDLNVAFERGLRNDELAMFHRFLDVKGLENNFRGPELEEYPFTIKDEEIGSLSGPEVFGAGVLVPLPQSIVSPAKYKGKDLAFPVDGSYSADNVELSSLAVLPAGRAATAPLIADESSPDTQRPGPQYINIRHRVNPDGSISNLNNDPQLKQAVRAGGYDALHYSDGAGDGWVRATCQELVGDGIENVPAYVMVGLPDFFPKVRQRDLMQWWTNAVPKAVRAGLWAAPPLVLSQTRIAANITLPIGFSVEDDTISAIVAEPRDVIGPVQEPNGPLLGEKTGLPDGSPGLFDPGWDTSQGIYYWDRDRPLQKFLAGYGLGSPFLEDAKLCAALGAYWPGVAPDATRTFAPDKQIGGIEYPYPTVAPLTDEEIGMVPSPLYGKPMPWDGVPGPSVVGGEFRYAEYRDALRTDYIDMLGTMTATLTSRVDLAEYKARIMAMAAVYWSLGIHDPDFKDDPESLGDDRRTAVQKILYAKALWAVLSFRSVSETDSVMAEAWQQANRRPASGPFFRVHVYRWGKQTAAPNDMYRVRVEMLEEAIAYVAGTHVLLQRNGGSWALDTSMPT